MVAVFALIVTTVLVITSFIIGPSGMVFALRLGVITAVVGGTLGLALGLVAGFGSEGKKGSQLSIVLLVLAGLFLIYSSSIDVSEIPV